MNHVSIQGQSHSQVVVLSGEGNTKKIEYESKNSLGNKDRFFCNTFVLTFQPCPYGH